MAKYEYAPFAALNAKAYRDYLKMHRGLQKITLTREQLEAICRDLLDYTDRDAEATAWAEQATRSAARIAELEHELRVAKGMAIVQRVIAEEDGQQ
jgi:hypothetical protein